MLRIGCKAHIAIGQDADQLAIGFGYRHAGNIIAGHKLERFGQTGIRSNGQRINHHTAFKFLYFNDFSGLFFRCQIAVQNTNATGLRHRNRHIAFGHCIHRRR